MKELIYRISLLFLFVAPLTTYAQQVNTLYFLENAPMRHLFNPAFQPISQGYANISPLGYSNFTIGNNSLTVSDLIYKDETTGNTITALHPNDDKTALLSRLQSSLFMNTDAALNILGFGFCIKDNGYFHFNLLERVESGASTPKELYSILLGGELDVSGQNSINLSQLALNASLYTEASFGYSHIINESWTVGGKLKMLFGTAYAGIDNSSFSIDASVEEWRIKGNSNLYVSGPIQWANIPNEINKDTLSKIGSDVVNTDDIAYLLKPSGYGVAVDIGFTYRPIDQLQISASLNDLGFIYWNNSRVYNCTIDTTFTGVGDFSYSDYVVDGSFESDSLLSDAQENLQMLLSGVQASRTGGAGFARALSAKLNLGVDLNFWDNRIGVGLAASTRLYNRRLYGEVTLGAALRPCNWFNIALSYSLVNNGKYSNIGAGLSFMPYDGINLTLAMDYIPTTYAYYSYDDDNPQKLAPIPYKAKGINVALGFSIVWGTNKARQ